MSKSSERITEKRTVITSSSSGYDDGDDSVYFKSGITPRQSTVVSRSSVGPNLRASVGGGGTVYSRTVEYGIGRSSGLGNLSPGGFEKASNTGVHSVKVNREREKKDMQDLNERFANYIEKVRFLEAQNRKLASELEHLKTKWGKETSAIKSMYEQELAEARKLIDDLTRDKNKLEIQNSSIQEEMNNLRKQMEDLKKYHSIDQEQINKLNQQVSDYEAEINMLRRTISSLETERGRDKERINKLQGEVDRFRVDLNNETLNHLDAENRRQTLEEEMEFLKKVHEQELKELAALAYRDTTEENREFWKSELSQAIRDIQSEYDNKVDQIRGDMESYYNLKVQEFRTGATKQNMEVTHVREENKKLVKSISDLKGRLADLEARNAQLESQYNSLLREYESIQSEHTMETVKLKEEITNLRAEMEAILVELQTLMDAKLSLELEIAAYRKLLESEESRVERLRRLGINVRNFRGSFLSSPVEYKSELVSDYSGNTHIDDEQTEKDITPDDDDTQLDMDKQHETANEDEVESKSDIPTVDKTTISNQETSKCITPEEVKESEIIAAQESNVSKAPPPQQQPESSQCQDIGGCSKVEGEKELHDEIVTGSATTSDVHDSVGNKSETDVNQSEEITSNTQIENDDVEEESFSTDNKTLSKDQTDDKDIARAEPDDKDIARAEPADKRIESEVDINSQNNQISADKDVENQNIENYVKDSVNESRATDTAHKEDEVTLTGADVDEKGQKVVKPKTDVEDQSRESENISKEDKPSEDNKTGALSDENKGDMSVEDSKQMKSSDGKEQEKPADDSEQMKSSDDKEQAKPADDSEQMKTSEDKEQAKSSDDKEQAKPADDSDQQMKTSYDKEQAKSSDDKEQAKSSDDKEQTKSSDDKEQAKSSDDKEQAKTADDSEQAKPADDGEQRKSVDNSEQTKSVDDSEQTKSVDDSEKIKSSADSEQMKSADDSKRYDERQQTEIENNEENKTDVDIATHDKIEPKSDNNEGSTGTENLPQTLDNQNQDPAEHCNQNNGTDDNMDKQNKPVISDDTSKQPDQNIASKDTTNKSESKGKGDESIEAPVTKEDENKITMNGDGHMNGEAGDNHEKLNNDAVETMNENEGEQDSHSSMKMMRGEVSAKTTYQKSSTGPVSIADVSPEGKYITLENTSSQRREVNLDGWKIRRELDDEGEIIYLFKNFTLKPHKSVRIFTRGASAEAGINDLVFREEESWGVGSRVTTTLFNEKGDEKATHKQRTNYN